MKLEFLNITKRSLSGVSMQTDKFYQAVFSAIKKTSTLEYARKASLFQIENNPVESSHLDREHILTILNELAREELIAQIFLLKYYPENRKIRVESCFIAPNEESYESLSDLFNATNDLSISSLNEWFATLPPPDPNILHKELEKDFHADDFLPAKELSHFILDLDSLLVNREFEVRPAPDTITGTVKELQRRLVNSGPALRVKGFGIIYQPLSNLKDMFEASEKFLSQIIIPGLEETSEEFKKRYEDIQIEETSYFMKDLVPDTTRFAQKKAEIIDHEFSARGRSEYFPGVLAVRVIQAVSERVEDVFHREWAGKCEEMHKEFKDKILAKDISLLEKIQYVSHENTRSLPPEVFDDLTRDPDMYYAKWERPKYTVHVFAPADADFIKDTVERMASVPPAEKWKMLALRQLIEEHDQDLKGLFDEKKFVRTYGKMLRSAYLDFMPIYWHVLLLFRIKLFEDKFFTNAKKKIIDKQKQFSQANAAREKRYRDNLEAEIRRKISETRAQNMARAVIQQLDVYYMQKKKVPTVGMVHEHFPEMNELAFHKFLNSSGFQMLMSSLNSDVSNAILLYPPNSEWKQRKTELIKKLQQQYELMSAELKDGPKPESYLHLKRILNYLRSQ